jgi:hypothetical protein
MINKDFGFDILCRCQYSFSRLELNLAKLVEGVDVHPIPLKYDPWLLVEVNLGAYLFLAV